jgi:hypothetical protein
MPARCTGCPVVPVGAGGVAVGIGWPYRSELCRWFGIGTIDNDEELLQEAVELANGADQVLVFLGLPGEGESEGLAELVAEL